MIPFLPLLAISREEPIFVTVPLIANLVFVPPLTIETSFLLLVTVPSILKSPVPVLPIYRDVPSFIILPVFVTVNVVPSLIKSAVPALLSTVLEIVK